MLCKDLYKGKNCNPLCTMYFVNNEIRVYLSMCYVSDKCSKHEVFSPSHVNPFIFSLNVQCFYYINGLIKYSVDSTIT